MATPTEIQRMLHTRQRAVVPAGLNACYYGIVGRIKRAPWVFKRLKRRADQIELLRVRFEGLSDRDLNQSLRDLQAQRRSRPSDSGATGEGLALLSVAAHRELGLRAYPVQIVAALALVDGCLSEVDTGEGKTLALALAAAFNAWSGLPCHVITANDYLAGRDAANLERFYKRAGLTVGRVLGESSELERRAGYLADITYTTAKEVAADYLRDRMRLPGIKDIGTRLSLSNLTTMVGSAEAGILQRGLYYALIDEADNSLIDEAVTPLIISRVLEAGDFELACSKTWEVAAVLEENVDYKADHSHKQIQISTKHIDLAAERIDLPSRGLWASRTRRVELLVMALEAREFFIRDVQYVVADKKVVIVDEATGRPMPMRTWRQGLHQLIEAKEKLPISGVSETLARISFQNFFRKYQHLAGASGTVREVASEIWKTYSIPTIMIPRHKTCKRQFLGHRFYADQHKKLAGLEDEIRVRHARKQPILVGTRSVEASEIVSELVDSQHLCYCILNAKNSKKEASLVSRAGHLSQITIATNMAGRGTDIHLEKGADILGGLHVIATEPHDSSRVDRQLFGRAGRQSDPGSVLALCSVDDELFVRFIPTYFRRFWARLLGYERCAKLGYLVGKCALFWAQKQAQGQARRRRKHVMDMETQLLGSLGFTKGVDRPRRPVDAV